jgi:hypothetical protein
MKKVRLRKQLRLSENRTDAAVAQELEALEAEDALEQSLLPSQETFGVEAVEQPFAFYGVLEMPPTTWDDIWVPDFSAGVVDETL